MKRFYEAICKRLEHEHEFELVKEVTITDPQGTNIRIDQYYMCKCGNTKKVEMNS